MGAAPSNSTDCTVKVTSATIGKIASGIGNKEDPSLDIVRAECILAKSVCHAPPAFC